MPGSPTIVQFQGQTPPWLLTDLDANLAAIKNLLRDVGNYSPYVVDSGAANAYVVTFAGTLTFSLSNNPWIIFKAVNANTGASTLNANAVGAKSILNPDGSQLRPGQIPAGGTVAVVYDGTNYIYLGAQSNYQPRGYLGGLVMSTAGASTTMTVGVGSCADDTNVYTIGLTSAIGKTTSAWAVGTGNGGLDTGSIANTTWYAFYAIMRLDTGVTDILFSTSASSPTMPTNYTIKRRIGWGRTDGAGKWLKFTQYGDRFMWDVPINDVNGAATAAGSRTARTVTCPPSTEFVGTIALNTTAANVTETALITTSDMTDTAASANLFTITVRAANDGATARGGVDCQFKLNSSSQLFDRGTAASTMYYNTRGWVDTRGRVD